MSPCCEQVFFAESIYPLMGQIKTLEEQAKEMKIELAVAIEKRAVAQAELDVIEMEAANKEQDKKEIDEKSFERNQEALFMMLGGMDAPPAK